MLNQEFGCTAFHTYGIINVVGSSFSKARFVIHVFWIGRQIAAKEGYFVVFRIDLGLSDLLPLLGLMLRPMTIFYRCEKLIKYEIVRGTSYRDLFFCYNRSLKNENK